MNAECTMVNEYGIEFKLRGTSWYSGGSYWEPPDGECELEEVEVRGNNVTEKVLKNKKLWEELEDWFEQYAKEN